MKLTCFENLSFPIEVSYWHDIKQSKMLLSYEVKGAVGQVEITPWHQNPQFKDDLWKTTCFELFLKQPASEGYEEWNFSSANEWAHYKFSKYRNNREKLTSEMPKLLLPTQEKTRLLFHFEISPPAPESLINPTCILRLRSGELTHWANQHPTKKPDFHDSQLFMKLRNSFM